MVNSSQPATDQDRDPLLVTTLQMIQQPDWFSGSYVETPSNGDLTIIRASRVQGQLSVDFTGGFTDSNLYPVQVGDYLEMKGGGLVHRIKAVQDGALQLVSALPSAIQLHPIRLLDGTIVMVGTANYHIVRQPRILSGETPLEPQVNMAIDLSTNQQFGGPLPPVHTTEQMMPDGTILYTDAVALLFLPGGALADCAGGFCPLWIRDTSEDSAFQGEPRLMTIYPRTGQIAAHPINEDQADPYAFCKDGRSSGL